MSNTRPRGFADWNPRPETRLVVEAVEEVLCDYSDHLPLTIRQIFYRLVVKDVVPKTELGYKQLCEYLNRARRARMIEFSAIRDDGFVQRDGYEFDNLSDAQDFLRRIAASARFDLQAGQERRLVLWCEAQGMVPQLERVGSRYGIMVCSSGGFDSVTAKHDMAAKLADQPHEILHVGDYDPSGEHVHLSLEEDLTAFVEAFGGDLSFSRIAVTPEQATRYQLPSAPPKATDRRSFSGTRTVQAEALPPDVLADVIERAIVDRIDLDALDEAREQQDEWRAILTG